MVEQERTDGAVVQAHGEFSGGAILATTDSARQIQEPVDGAASIRSTSLQAPGRSACVQRIVRLAALLSERSTWQMNSDSLKSKPRNCLRSMQAQLTQHAGQCAQRRLGPKVIDVRGDSRYRILQRWDSSAGTQHQPHVAEEKRDQPPAALSQCGGWGDYNAHAQQQQCRT